MAAAVACGAAAISTLTSRPVAYRISDPGEDAGDGAPAGGRGRCGRGSTGTSCWITCTIAPTPTPSRKAATLELNADAPIHAPMIAGAPATSPSSGEAAHDGARSGDRRDDREPLGGVVDREADHEEGAQRQRADGVGGPDREPLAEVVQADRRSPPAARA